MRVHPDWIVNYTVGVMVLAGACLWQVRAGMDPSVVIVLGLGTLVLCTVAYVGAT